MVGYVADSNSSRRHQLRDSDLKRLFCPVAVAVAQKLISELNQIHCVDQLVPTQGTRMIHVIQIYFVSDQEGSYVEETQTSHHYD